MVYIDEHIMDFDLDAALQQVSEQRREQALRFKFERGQRTCVLAYLLLKKALHEEFGITGNPVFEYGEHGKPAPSASTWSPSVATTTAWPATP